MGPSVYLSSFPLSPCLTIAPLCLSHLKFCLSRVPSPSNYSLFYSSVLSEYKETLHLKANA
ncbi:Breast cancer type 2 susceptibility protein [Clarias magur]|uniref:Breast cancer type 2 susceptibility protein n=1 Tax=Clarias magur TaxID=1594786 RepID=A0A8J4T9V9_CLAMG|nr:Breast cancer type 2 susceptibility protein [Clarias magur]